MKCDDTTAVIPIFLRGGMLGDLTRTRFHIAQRKFE